MTPRTVLTTALWILLVAAMIAALGWVTRQDDEIARASLERYCEDAAIWAVEEARGVPLNRRTGQPDYRGIAAEQCPGMRPAEPAQGVALRVGGNSSAIVTGSNQRELANR